MTTRSLRPASSVLGRGQPLRAVALALFAVLAPVGLGPLFGACSARAPRVQFTTQPVKRGPLSARVTANGTVSALVTVQVGSQVSGRIQQLLVDYNSPVKKGQVVARIDPQLYQATVAQARANVVAAGGNVTMMRAKAVDAHKQCQRASELFHKDLVAHADADTACATDAAAQAQVWSSAGSLEQAKAALNQAQINLDYTTIVSPTNGVVISRNVDVGQTVAATLQAPVLFTIAEDLSRMQVDTSVAEADVGKLKDGMAAEFTVDAYTGERFLGVVRQIRNAPQTVQNVVTYDAVIDVPNPELKLRPGMTANAVFVYARRDSALQVSNAALRFRPPASLLPPGGSAGKKPGVAALGLSEAHAAPVLTELEDPARRTVYVLQAGRVVPVVIRTGISDGTMTEVVQGDLKEGDPVIVDVVGADDKPASSNVPPAMRRVL